MPARKKKPEPEEEPQVEEQLPPEDDDEPVDDEPEENGENGGDEPPGHELPSVGEIEVKVTPNKIMVTIPRDGNEADTLHRIADLVDGL
jgi:hypothetical protein